MHPQPHRRRAALARMLTIPVLLATLLVPRAMGASAPPAPDPAAITRQLDQLLGPIFPPARPGAAVLVARDGKPIYRRGFGLADVEHKVAIEPAMAFRIGSVTKQFTAALVMQQVERGKIGLEDDVTRYLPDYPTHGRKITIENLLTHTSGIADYTALPAWQARIAEPLTPTQLIALFKDEPMAFAPGERWAYSNSNYVLLGAILEKVTGHSYAAELEARILRPLGMKRSAYGHDEPYRAGEAHGYQDTTGTKPSAPLSMTSPYAAGSIVASVDDLLRWDNGLEAGKVIGAESRRRMFTPFTLADGRPTTYGYGWIMGSYEGHRVQWHNGGINGFTSAVSRLPDDHLYVAVLTNDEGLPFDAHYLATQIAGIAIGTPLPEPGAVSMTADQLDRFVGVYAMDSVTSRVIAREGNTLYSTRSGGGRFALFPTNDSTFAFRGRLSRLTFGRDAAGRFARVTLNQEGIEEMYLRTDRPIPAARQAVTLEPAQLDACVGVYELAPGFRMTFTHEGATLFAQATGQGKAELFPESPTRFFVKVVDAQFEFVPGPDGRMASVILHQGGRDVPGKRVE
jgi:CubicO group peptidase (beta-lactamase class C family)